MNKVPILHNNTDKNDLIKKYYIALIPLLLFSIYKNGIILFNNDLINFIKVLHPLYFYIISIVIGYIVSLIIKENTKENILISLIISCTVSINTNMLFYPLLLFIGLFIGNVINKSKLKVNIASFTRILLILGLLLNSYSYLNIAEKLNKFNYNYFDIFNGLGIGGLANTSTLILILSLIILLTCKYYKRVIPLTASITYIVISFAIIIFTKNYEYLKIILNGMNYFSFIFIAPDLYITPTSKKGMFIYALLIGIITSILSYIGLIYEASFIGVLLVSLSIPLINKRINKKYLEGKF